MEKHAGGSTSGALERVPQEELTLDEAIKDAYERAKPSKPDDEQEHAGGA